MTEPESVVGRGFDWFAIDSVGDVALFATAGFGFIPSSILATLSKHAEVAHSIPTPNIGSLTVWDDISEQGLHVYDWQPNGGPYKRLRRKSVDLEKQLADSIKVLPVLPFYPGRFVDTTEFPSADSFDTED